MFVTMLDEAQRRVLLRAAGALAERDGARPDAETEMLTALNVEAGFDELPPLAGSDDELFAEAAAAFKENATARNIFLLELAGVAVCDGSAGSEEVALLNAFADQFGVDASVVAEALAIGSRAKALVDEAQSFIVSEPS